MPLTRLGFLRSCPECLVFGVTCAVLLLLTGSGPNVAARQASAVDVKAAFTINFLRFVDWPVERQPAPNGTYVVAVLNDDPLARALGVAATGQKVDGREIAVRSIASGADARAAHLLFIGAAEERRLAALVQQASGWHVLTVGDTPGFGQSGVMLNLFLANERVQFEANTAAADRAGIKLRSTLLRLARIVG